MEFACFNPVFQISTAKIEINLFNNHILIVAPVTFAPAGAMKPSTEFLSFSIKKDSGYLVSTTPYTIKYISFLKQCEKVSIFTMR